MQGERGGKKLKISSQDPNSSTTFYSIIITKVAKWAIINKVAT